MSRRGNGYDNAAMESFWSALKRELVHRRHFATRAEARAAIFDWIEVFYNRTRRHSALGFKSPVDFENQIN
jgi:transposase InsO family protein